MLHEARRPNAPFRVILVWKFSRFTRNREHSVALKAMLRRKGVRVVSITEHADDTPYGRLMEGMIETFDEFYSANLGQEVLRGMKEAARRGFWVSPNAPYGYRKVKVEDGAKMRPRLVLKPTAAGVVERIFGMVESGKTLLEVTRTLNGEGIASPKGKRWTKNVVHKMLGNEAYVGTFVWGRDSKHQAEPLRVEGACPAIVTKSRFRRVAKLLKSRSRKVSNPRRMASSYLLSGLVKCRRCKRALTGQAAKSGKFSYYVCQSVLKQGRGTCGTPRLNARRFEGMIIEQVRENILTESNMRSLVRMIDEEMDGVAAEHRKKLEAIDRDLADVRRRLERLYQMVETTDLDLAEIAPRIREHRERQGRLEAAAEEERLRLSERRAVLDNVETIARYATDMGQFLRESELTEARPFLRSLVKEIVVEPGEAAIRYTIPMPEDSPIGRSDAEHVALGNPVLSTVTDGGRWRI